MKNYQERVPTNIMLKLTLNGDNKLKREKTILKSDKLT